MPETPETGILIHRDGSTSTEPAAALPIERPAPGSIITLLEPIMDERGDELPAKLDVVALDVHDDGSILVSADNAAEESVDAWVHPGEWYQRPEEVRPTPALPVEERPMAAEHRWTVGGVEWHVTRLWTHGRIGQRGGIKGADEAMRNELLRVVEERDGLRKRLSDRGLAASLARSEFAGEREAMAYAACAALVRQAGCIGCLVSKSPDNPRHRVPAGPLEHAPRCPIALALAIEARGKE